MAGFTLEDSAAFDEWQFFQTEALKDEVASALVRLATYFTSQGDFDRAIGHARRWLAVDPSARAGAPAPDGALRAVEPAGGGAAAVRDLPAGAARRAGGGAVGADAGGVPADPEGRSPAGPDGGGGGAGARSCGRWGRAPTGGWRRSARRTRRSSSGARRSSSGSSGAVSAPPFVAAVVGASGSGKSLRGLRGAAAAAACAGWLADRRPAPRPGALPGARRGAAAAPGARSRRDRPAVADAEAGRCACDRASCRSGTSWREPWGDRATAPAIPAAGRPVRGALHALSRSRGARALHRRAARRCGGTAGSGSQGELARASVHLAG